MPGGRITLTPEWGSPLTLIVAGPPERGGGVGGWESSERAGQRPAKWWKGSPDDTCSWDLILDQDAVGGPSIERRLRVLRDMGLPGGKDNEPPQITISGDIWDADARVPWVIEDITLGDRLYNGDGTLRRQAVTVPMSRASTLDEIDAVRIRSTRHGSRKRRRVVVAHSTDTLRAIALRELGNGSRWKDLKSWNKRLKKVNPDARLRAGLHITIR